MFSDIRGFTALVESQPPEETIDLLNTYYTLMFDAIHSHGGVVNQMIGDGLMAIFDAPLPLADHPSHAVRAACSDPARQGVDWSNYPLPNANLYYADLKTANLYNADLTNAFLDHANLYGANLSNAILIFTGFDNADLTNANLYSANLSGANLSGANLFGTNLSAANLTGAIVSFPDRASFVVQVNLAGATLDGVYYAGDVPEPESYLMMLLGSGIVLFAVSCSGAKSRRTGSTTHVVLPCRAQTRKSPRFRQEPKA